MNLYEKIQQMSIDEMAQELMRVANWNPTNKRKGEKIFGKNNPELYRRILLRDIKNTKITEKE